MLWSAPAQGRSIKTQEVFYEKAIAFVGVVLTLTMLCEVLPFGAFAQSDVGQQLALAAAQSLEEENGEATIIGKCGDNLQWSLSSDGVLTIDGRGDDDYRPLNYPLAPWNAHMNKINTIIANSGMTHIGNSAFYYCSSLTAVTIPDSVSLSVRVHSQAALLWVLSIFPVP